MTAKSASPAKKRGKMTSLHLSRIVLDRRLQMRMDPALSEQHVEEMVAELEAGKKLPRVIVYDVDGKLILVDGHHTHQAFVRLKRQAIPVQLYKGDWKAAVWHAVGCNKHP